MNGQNEVTENNVNNENVQPGCSAAPDRTENETTDVIDDNEE